MPHMHPFDLALSADRIGQTIQAVADDAIDPFTPAAARVSANWSATVLAMATPSLCGLCTDSGIFAVFASGRPRLADRCSRSIDDSAIRDLLSARIYGRAYDSIARCVHRTEMESAGRIPARLCRLQRGSWRVSISRLPSDQIEARLSSGSFHARGCSQVINECIATAPTTCRAIVMSSRSPASWRGSRISVPCRPWSAEGHPRLQSAWVF